MKSTPKKTLPSERKRSSAYTEVHHSLLSGKKSSGTKIKKKEEEKKKRAPVKGKKRTRTSFPRALSAFFSRRKRAAVSEAPAQRAPEMKIKKSQKKEAPVKGKKALSVLFSQKKPASHFEALREIPETKTQEEHPVHAHEKQVEIRIRTAHSFSRFLFPLALPAGVFVGMISTHWFLAVSDAKLYPATCLGGWENPKNAEGAPSLPTKSSPEQFSDRNSAVLRNSLAQIFCGDFTNAFSAENFPKKMVLKFSWATVVSTFPHVLELPNKATAKDSNAILDEPFTVGEEADGIASGTPPEATSSGETKPASAEASAGKPVSFFEGFLNIAFASSASGTPDLKISSSTASTSEPVGFLVASSTEETAAPVLEKPKTDASDFLQVLYTLDGQTWKQLGTVTRENLADLSFQVPVSNPEALAHFQVSIQNVVSLDDPPVIYLDGMWLESGE